jgi:hypothetical protein
VIRADTRLKKLHYVKAHAYRVKPLSDKGSLAIDGEIFPFEEFQVEVHQGLATLLSPHGHYAADFQVPSVAPGSGSGRGSKSNHPKGDNSKFHWKIQNSSCT